MDRIALALAVSLISSTAIAQPWPERGRYPYEDRYDRYSDRYGDRSFVDRPWQPLLVRSTGRRDVDVVVFRGRGGRLGWLRIAPAPRGSQVVIEYVDRPPQTVWLDRGSDGAGGAIIELDRRARIGQILIQHRWPPRYGYAVYGS